MMPNRRGRDREFGRFVDQFRSDYDAAFGSDHARTRLGLNGMGTGSDYHIRSETAYFRMLELVRDLRRNDSIVEATIARSTLNIVGDSFLPAPSTGDRKLDADLYDEFVGWGASPDLCDESGEHTFHELLSLTVHNTLADGDVITLGLDNGRLQMHESHLCRNPKSKEATNCVIGVEVGPTRRRIAYHLRAENVNPRRVSFGQSSTRYPVRDSKTGVRQVFHTYFPSRYSATRGITALAPVVMIAQMFEDLNFAKVVQAKILSLFHFYRYRAASGVIDHLPTGPTPAGTESSETRADGSTRTMDDAEPGTELFTDPGEEIRTITAAGAPNAEYFPHAKLLLSLIGINVGQPYVMVMMDASESNFTGWRAAVEEARRGFRRNQQSTVNRYASPIYRWWLSRKTAKSATLRNMQKKIGDRIFSHTYRLPTWPYVSPAEDAATGLLRIKNGLTSPRRYHGELSQDWEEIATETIADNAYAIRRAISMAAKINAKLPPEQHIHWRELLALPAPDGVAINIAPPSSAGGSQK